MQTGVGIGLGLIPAVAAAVAAHRSSPTAIAVVLLGAAGLSWSLFAAYPDAIGANEVWWSVGCGLLGAGLTFGASGRAWIGRLVGLVLFLGVSEVGLRLYGAEARDDGPALWAGERTWSFPCMVPYLIEPPEDVLDRPRPRVVHLGDSMTEGPGPRGDTFVGRLDTADAARTHLRLALAGTGPDCALFILRQLPPLDAVVVHIFPGNDAPNLGYRYPWCDEQSLLVWEEPGLPTRCPDAPRPLSWSRRIPWDPAPYAWRWLAARSALANLLLQRLWEPLPHWLGTQDLNDGSMEVMFHRVGLVLSALKAEADRRGVPLFATLLPWEGMRPDDRYRAELQAHTEAWRVALVDHDIPTLDLIRLFDGRVDPPEPGVFAGDDPPDPHFGPKGFEAVFEAMKPWMDTQLAREGVPPVRPPPSPPRGPAGPPG